MSGKIGDAMAQGLQTSENGGKRTIRGLAQPRTYLRHGTNSVAPCRSLDRCDPHQNSWFVGFQTL